MTCEKDSYIMEWENKQDAIDAWEACGCITCTDALIHREFRNYYESNEEQS